MKPLYDEGAKDYHDLKISSTAKAPKRLPAIAKKGDTDPKPAQDSDFKKASASLSQTQKKDMPDCAKTDPESCSTNDWPLPKPLTWPLFPEAHKDVHDFKPAPCFDQNGKFMDRCNPLVKNAGIEA